MARTLPRALRLLLSCAAIAACALLAACASAATDAPATSGAAGHGSATSGTAGHGSATSGAATVASGSATTPADAATPPVQYGLGDSAGHFAHCIATTSGCCYGDPATCPAGTVTGYWNDPWFKALASSASAHRVRYVRLFVSLDAVAQFNGSPTAPGCVPSRVLRQSWIDAAGRTHPAGESLQDLLAGLVQAHADGLIPVVSISGYPIASARAADMSPAPNPTTPAGYWSYRCGIEGILGAVSRLPGDEQPHVWEAFNEPDRIDIYSEHAALAPGPAAGSSGQTAGSAGQAAGSGGQAAGSGGQAAGSGGQAAGSGGRAAGSGGQRFGSVTGDQAPGCAITPTGIADGPALAACDYVLADRLVHGFAGHAGDTLLAGVFSNPSPSYLQPYVAQLAHTLPAAEFPTSWAVHDYGGVTRGYQGSSLTDLVTWDEALGSDTHGRAKDVWITETGMLLSSRRRLDGCRATATNPADTLGACISGNSAAQVADMTSFFAMPSAGTSVPITHLFWYQWQGAPTWDSGLTDAAGVPRPAWCAFFGGGTCPGNPNAS